MKRILGTIAFAIAIFAAPAQATNGMRMIGFGPVQNSMGGASVAAPLDARHRRLEPGGSRRARRPVRPRRAVRSCPTSSTSMTTPGPSASAGSSDRPTDYLPTLAGVYRFQDQLTFGFAALGTAGMGVDYKADPAA